MTPTGLEVDRAVAYLEVRVRDRRATRREWRALYAYERARLPGRYAGQPIMAMHAIWRTSGEVWGVAIAALFRRFGEITSGQAAKMREACERISTSAGSANANGA